MKKLLIHSRAIEKTFRAFLKVIVEQSDTCPPLSYTSPMSSITETFHPRGSSDSPSVNSFENAIDFQVTSPLFYTQLVRYAHLTEFFTTSLLASTPENRIFFVSDSQRFLTLFDSQAIQIFAVGNPCSNLQRKYRLDSMHWHFLKWLRNHRSKTSYNNSSKKVIECRAQDIRTFSLSALDLFSMRDSDGHASSQYRRAVIKVLASDLIAFGQPALIDAFYTATRVILLWFFVQSATRTISLLGRSALAETEIERSQTIYLGVSRTVLGLIATHTWCALAYLV